MIIKFDGIDACGKTTLSRAVAESLSSKGYRATVIGEFTSPTLDLERAPDSVPIRSLRIREAALDPEFDCDDIERQLLLHFLSRRNNRIEIPHLETHNDFVIVDRSTISNYAYSTSIDKKFHFLSRLAVGGIEKADLIFWIDTPLDTCMERMSSRSADAVERKRRAYFEQVRSFFEEYTGTHKTVCRLDGRWAVSSLVKYVEETIKNKP